MMTKLEKNVLDSLTELEHTAKTMATVRPRPGLGAILARLDDLAGQLPPGTDANLLHYLHKKSYEKARLFLLGRQAENARGNCGR